MAKALALSSLASTKLSLHMVNTDSKLARIHSADYEHIMHGLIEKRLNVHKILDFAAGKI